MRTEPALLPRPQVGRGDRPSASPPGEPPPRRPQVTGTPQIGAYELPRVLTDFAMLVIAVAAVVIASEHADFSLDGMKALYALPPLTVLLLHWRGMYRRPMNVSLLDSLVGVVATVSIAAMTLLAGVVLIDGATESGQLVVRAWLLAGLTVAGGRVLLDIGERWGFASRRIHRPTLIVGSGDVADRVARRLLDQPELGLEPTGFLDVRPRPTRLAMERRLPFLGTPDELAEVAERTGAEHVVVTFGSAREQQLQALVRRCERLGLKLMVVPRLFESINRSARLEYLGGLPVFELHAVDPNSAGFTAKHAFDRVAAALLILIGAPLLIGIAAAVKATSRGSVFYKQLRVGRDGRIFEMLKFRTMHPILAGEAPPLPPPGVGPGGVEGPDRRTAVGRWLRRTSLDELPQLFNVLKGDMSLVGPRPERPDFARLFADDVYRYTDRVRVRSGITGWAQVHGLRGQTSLADRVEWDNYYIDNWSLGLDLKILLMTVMAILRPAE